MRRDTVAQTDIDLSTTYLGLRLRTPLVASSGPLTGQPEPLQSLEDHGIAAVVLPSLFAEDVTPGGDDADGVGARHLRYVRTARDLLSIPVIGSLNGVRPGAWTGYAQRIADAGADALELNLYDVVTDANATAQEIESTQLAVVEQVRRSLTVPLAVKVGPYYTTLAGMARRLVEAGADGLVLFNRFYQPDIDPRTSRVTPWLQLSRRAELRLPLRWTAILSRQLEVSLALTGGVHHAPDVERALLAGADVAMMTSILIDQGPLHIGVVEADLVAWVREQGRSSLAQLAGSVDAAATSERTEYIRALRNYTATFHDSWGFGGE